MKICKLQKKDLVLLYSMMILGFSWLLIDQFYFDTHFQRLTAFGIVLLIIYTVLFAAIKPERPLALSNSIVIYAMPVVLTISLITHLLILKDFSFKSVQMWLLTTIEAYLVGIIHAIFVKPDIESLRAK